MKLLIYMCTVCGLSLFNQASAAAGNKEERKTGRQHHCVRCEAKDDACRGDELQYVGEGNNVGYIIISIYSKNRQVSNF